MTKYELLELCSEQGINLSVEEMHDLSNEQIQQKIIDDYRAKDTLRKIEAQKQKEIEDKKASDKRFYDILNGKRS